MKTKLIAALAAWAYLMPICRAQPFDSGSNGSLGAFNPTVTTNLQVPPDGIFHFTTVTIQDGVLVYFTPNALNTPVYILAQSDVVMSGSGAFFLDGTPPPIASRSSPGRGGPGGFNGGFGAVQGRPGSDGQGPGGGQQTGYRGGVFSTSVGSNSNIYGNSLLSPLVGGSGGAGDDGGFGGSGGGGAILIASSTRIALDTGSGVSGIYARGGRGDNNGGGGSGGAVRLVAPVISGDGYIRVAGGDSDSGNKNGGAGRIRLDTTNRLAWKNLHFESTSKWSVGSQMQVFPPNNPRLDIVEAAGQAIAAGIANAVQISLPPLSPTNQVVKVQATGFTTNVLVTVAVVPEAGSSLRFDSEIAVTGTNATIGSINVIIPADSFCNISVWTR